jgi:putative N6-adenine-specific DNA methylase
MGAQTESALRLTGTVGANRVMESELLRLVKRSPFRVRVPKPARQGSTTLRYAFDPAVAWVAACYHRSSSRIGWELASSPAVRLEPLVADLVPLLAADDRLPRGRTVTFTVEVKGVEDFEAGPLQLRGAVKSAFEQAMRRRGGQAVVRHKAAEWELVVRRVGNESDRRTLLILDIGGGARHLRGQRVAQGPAPLRETLAAQLVLLAKWMPHVEPLVDPTAGSGTIAVEAALLARGCAVRKPSELATLRFPVFADFPSQAPPLYPDTRPCIFASDINEECVAWMIGNLRASGLTGRDLEQSIVVRSMDATELTPARLAGFLPDAPGERGLFAFNPPYGRRMGGKGDDVLRLYRDLGSALKRFDGWRAAVIVANEDFKGAFNLRPSMVKPTVASGVRSEFMVFDLGKRRAGGPHRGESRKNHDRRK